MLHAIEHLRIAAEIAETNMPFNERRGDYAQADLERKVARDCRQAMSALQHMKMASFLAAKPKFSDKARVVGRTGFEGALGGYTGSATAAVLLGLLGKKMPGAIKPNMFAGGVGAAGGIGALLGGQHGYRASTANARKRLNPIEILKRKIGL